MELDIRRYQAIDDSGYHLLQDLHQANSSEVGASTLGYHHHPLPCSRRRELSPPEVRMNYGDDLLPVSWVGVFLLRCRANPHPEVFGPHARWTPGAM